MPQRLAALIRQKSLGYGKFITLATPNPDGSRNESNFYLDMRKTLMDPEGLMLAGQAMAGIAMGHRVRFVAGMAEAGIPLVGQTITEAWRLSRVIRGLWRRKGAKAHGTGRLLEGLRDDETLAGQRVMVVEDVFTTGASSLQVVKTVRELGGHVVTVAALVDREEGAEETFNHAGVNYETLYKARDLLPAGFEPLTRRLAA